MLRAVICVGDTTSHGGKVLEGDERFSFHGRPVSRLGHKTYCPQCRGDFPVVEGLSFFTQFGPDAVVEGMRTGCGAELIASVTKGVLMIDDRRGDAQPAQANDHDIAASTQQARYKAQFRAVDDRSGAPVHGLAYRIDLPDGSSLHGHTDEEGCTEEVSGHAAADVHLHWLA
ncbi:MAG: PAAR domain-containing protein [Telluria sp.]